MNKKLASFCIRLIVLIAICDGASVNRSMTACDCRVPYCELLPTTPRPDCPIYTPRDCVESTTLVSCPPCECPTIPTTTARTTTTFTCPPCTTPTTEPPRTTTPCQSYEENPTFTKPIYQSSLPTWPIAGTTVRLGIHANTSDGAPVKYELLTSFEFMTLTTEQNIIFTSNVGEGAFVGPNNVMVIEVTATVIGDEERMSSAAVVIIFPRSTTSRNGTSIQSIMVPCFTDWPTETTGFETYPSPSIPETSTFPPDTSFTPTWPQESSTSTPEITEGTTVPSTETPTPTSTREPETSPSTSPPTETTTTTPEPTFEYCCWLCYGGPTEGTTCEYVTEPCPTTPPPPTCPACTCPTMTTTEPTTTTTSSPTTCSCPFPTTTTSTSKPCPTYEDNPTFTKSIYLSSLPTWPIAGTTVRLGIHANTTDEAPVRYELLTAFEFLTLTTEQNIIFTSNVGDGAFVGPNNVMVIEIVATVIGNEERTSSSAVIIVFPRSTTE